MSGDESSSEAAPRLSLVEAVSDEAVEAIAVVSIAGIALAGEPSTVSVGGIAAIAGGRRAVKGLRSLAGGS